MTRVFREKWVALALVRLGRASPAGTAGWPRIIPSAISISSHAALYLFFVSWSSFRNAGGSVLKNRRGVMAKSTICGIPNSFPTGVTERQTDLVDFEQNKILPLPTKVMHAGKGKKKEYVHDSFRMVRLDGWCEAWLARSAGS